jgi:hypothetical protein
LFWENGDPPSTSFIGKKSLILAIQYFESVLKDFEDEDQMQEEQEQQEEQELLQILD